MIKEDAYDEHRQNVKKAITDQKIILNGETIDIYDENSENFKSSDPNDFPKPQIYIVYNAKDEKEPYDYIYRDPLYQNGWVKDWEIKELDLVHAERDDELVLRQ